MYKKVVVAGTFNTLHKGHKRLIEEACRLGKSVLIGLTTDEFVKKMKKKAKPFEQRKSNIIRFLGNNIGKAEIFELEDEYGPSITDKTIDGIVVSTETVSKVEKINNLREKKGLKPLHIITMPIVYAEDLKKISCERIERGEISRDGKRLSPLTIILGSTNPSKIRGVEIVAEKLFPRITTTVEGVETDSKVEKQPFSDATIQGAINRAIQAYSKLKTDYSVGVESGLFEFNNRFFDVQWCAVFDGETITLGHSMGFECPTDVVQRIKKEKKELGEVFGEISGKKNIGGDEGAIGFLSKGLSKRTDMTEQAFLCAMIPRINRFSPI